MGLIGGSAVPKKTVTSGKLAPAPAPAKATTAKPAAAPKTQVAAAPQGDPFDDAIPRGGARQYLLPLEGNEACEYVLKVNKLSLIFRHESKNTKGKCESTTGEFEVIESEHPKCKPGYQASVTFTDKHLAEVYLQDVKGMLCGILGKEPHEVNRDLWHACCGRRPEGMDDDQWAETEAEVNELVVGKLVKVTVKYKEREGKTPITLYAWEAIEAAE